jgi:hypothetical protein
MLQCGNMPFKPLPGASFVFMKVMASRPLGKTLEAVRYFGAHIS